jgi:AcrR family transcriptional regulator
MARQARGERTRGALIDAAIAILTESGYAALTTRAVQAASGVSRGSLLHQFGTREDLLAATVVELVERRAERAQAIIERFAANPPPDRLGAAVAAVRELFSGADFLAVSDHNTVTQRRYFHPHSSADLVFVRAMEVTTDSGHANVFGVDDWIDFRMERPEDAHRLSRIVHEKGGLLSVNHDKPPIPWRYELPELDCMEVWQQAWLSRNWISLARYQERLAAGLRISAIGGSDFHQPAELVPEGPLALARPTTVLWLEELSEDAVLAAMKAGRGYVTESPAGPHLALTIDGVPMGSTVSGGRAEAHVKGAAGDLLVWYDASGEIARMPIEEDDQVLVFEGTPQTFLRCEILADASQSRLVEEFRAAVGEKPLPWGLSEAEIAAAPLRRAVSNPVYIARGE